MTTYIKTMKDKDNNIIAPRTVASAVYLSDGTTTLEQNLNSITSNMDSVLIFNGAVSDILSLPSQDVKVGDLYYVTSESSHYFWNGTDWVVLGGGSAELLEVATGGTGAVAFTSGHVLIGNGTNAVSTLSRSGIDTRSTFPPESHNQAWSTISTTPTTLSGYGITDAALSSHTHGNITNAGAIGLTADLVVKTTTSGVLTTLAAGTTSQYLRGDGTWQTVTVPSGLTSGSTSVGYLTYNGTTATTGQFDGGSTAPTATNRLNYGGYFYATRVYNAVYNDYAEYFEKGSDHLEPGDVVALDEDGKYIKSQTYCDKKVVGVYSDSYGHLLGGTGSEDDENNFIPIGLAGRVSVKVVGDIKKGDLLVASSIKGVAAVGNQQGCIIGKALEDHNGFTIDKIKMLIMNC